MIFYLAVVVILMGVCCDAPVHGSMGITPQDATAIVDQKAVFKCSLPSASEDVEWVFNEDHNFIYAGGQVILVFQGRIKVENKSGVSYLTIPSVKPKDAGKYTCKGEGFGRHQSSAILTVIDLQNITSMVNLRAGEKINCSAYYANRNCSHSLQRLESNDTTPVGGQIKQQTEPGNYLCSVVCDKGGDSFQTDLILIAVSDIKDIQNKTGQLPVTFTTVPEIQGTHYKWFAMLILLMPVAVALSIYYRRNIWSKLKATFTNYNRGNIRMRWSPIAGADL